MFSLVVFRLVFVAVPGLVLAGPVTAVAITRPLWRPGYRPLQRTRNLALLAMLVALAGALTLAALELLGWSIAVAIDYRDQDVPDAVTNRGLAGAGLSFLFVAALLVTSFALRRHRTLHGLALLAPVLQILTWQLLASMPR